MQQSEHWRFAWPCSPLSVFGLFKAMAILQRWVFTSSCLASNLNTNVALFASHSPKASSRCSHPMQFRHGLFKNRRSSQNKDRILGPIGRWSPPPLFLLAPPPWASLTLLPPGALLLLGSSSSGPSPGPWSLWVAWASNPPWLSSSPLHVHMRISIVFYFVRWRAL